MALPGTHWIPLFGAQDSCENYEQARFVRATKPVGVGVAAASASAFIESRLAGAVERRMDHPKLFVTRPFSQVVSIDPECHPPLYYLLLHYWIQLPWTMGQLVSIRAMSAAWALVATVVI